jgi:hypothetical protein
MLETQKRSALVLIVGAHKGDMMNLFRSRVSNQAVKTVVIDTRGGATISVQDCSQLELEEIGNTQEWLHLNASSSIESQLRGLIEGSITPSNIWGLKCQLDGLIEHHSMPEYSQTPMMEICELMLEERGCESVIPKREIKEKKRLQKQEIRIRNKREKIYQKRPSYKGTKHRW